MASKSAVFVLLMVVVAVAAPIAVAQLGTVGRLLDRIRIQGTVFCSINATGTASPVLPNARVQLRCGIGDVVSSATTDRFGLFLMQFLPRQTLSSILAECNLFVITPLARCNAALPGVGVLRSPLQFIGNTTVGPINNINIVPTGFVFFNVTV
ncbi:hypothetical protein I3843_02G046500 [Carya illinoinensis]|uniref:Uncharacterized protein n=1 Tax=Carya illinoinensis TaxID=32201 RepID=A0A922FSK7_CARIL|nr:hypothetical protein I3843_Q015300 [Carya illinoinensis]KAG6725995.1 hypothetical protein I3842_02G058800 [Carya illinoinensis]KAG7990868.1 hypothetical protein I3843_02G046500 [Carya illinoinensis]